MRVPVVLVALVVSAGQTMPGQRAQLPTGWTAVSPPGAFSDEAYCANWAAEEWAVTLVGDTELNILKDEQRPAGQTLPVDDGRLEAQNRGEFGGEVWWVPRSGTKELVAQTNLVSFLRSGSGIFGLVGLAHLVTNEGSLVRFDRNAAGKWEMVKTVDLTAAPQAFTTRSNGDLVVVMAGALAVVRPPETREIVHRNEVWHFTYPNSVVQDRSGIIYIGMRSAVAQLTPGSAGLAERWLVPSNCTRRVVVDRQRARCRCATAPGP
jgi:hypothetical protein